MSSSMDQANKSLLCPCHRSGRRWCNISDDQLDNNLELNTYSFDPTAFLNPASEPEPPISPSSLPVAAVDRPASVDVDADNDQNKTIKYSQEYPDLAGVVKAEADTKFERIRKEQEEEGVGVWSPFLDEDEWKLAQWLARNVGQKQAENFLKLPIVCNCFVLPLSCQPVINSWHS